MIGIIISGHGSYPIGILESVQLIAGKQPKVRAITFKENVEELEKALEKAISEVDTGSGVVCFTDLAGGTPFNICSKLAVKNPQVRVIGGANAPMILSSLFLREMDVNEFVSKVIEEGKENIKSFAIKAKETVQESEGI